ncbi:MAG: hypothetical protein ABMB14_04445 [Myxococcota bacterium]
MPAVRWTRWGAVAVPEVLQVRLEPVFAGRVAAGAPKPPRALRADELSANVRWFAEPGPRGRPIAGLVLSGMPAGIAGELRDALDPTLDPIGAVLEQARAASVRRVTVHVDAAGAAAAANHLGALVDGWVIAVRSPDEAAVIPVGAQVIVPLDADRIDRLAEAAAAVARTSPSRITFTWPFPGGGTPAPLPAVRPALAAAIAAVGGIPWGLKGLPACVVAGIPGVADRVARSGNRWYVDADHQLDRALLFFPEVARFAKREGCRFCALDDRCDGVAEEWLRQGLVPALIPVQSG